MKRVLLILWILSIVLPVSGQTKTGVWIDQPYNPDIPGIEYNPLKGMFPYDYLGSSTKFPKSLEWFYLPLRSLQTGYNTFDWTALETKLTEISSRGHHAVFRIYLDYPGQNIGTPQFLIDDGVVMRSYTENGNSNGKSKSPNWNDARVITALQNFITAFGAKYDGDIRIGYVTIGLYGFWGEWHNYPYDPAWSMNEINRDKLLTAYKNAFAKTKLALRDPYGTGNPTLKNSVGYHDDSFAFETLEKSWAFWPQMLYNDLSENWKSQTMGGEIRPEIQSTVWNNWPNTVGQDMSACITTTHVSWLLSNWQFSTTMTSQQYANAIQAQKMMGYEFFISSIKLNTVTSGNFDIQIKCRNKGVAPIYYNWNVEFAALNTDSDSLISLGTATNWNISGILPGGSDLLKSFTSVQTLDSGRYKLLMRFVNPLSNGNPLRFANATQDADRDGWLSLAGFGINTPPYSDNADPAISMLSPSDGSICDAPFTIKVNAFDTDGTISKVEFFIDSNKIGEDLSSPYTHNWNTTLGGTYVITARATDDSGAVSIATPVTVTVNPSVTGIYNAESIAQVTVYPNPATEQLLVTSDLLFDPQVQIKIVNDLGEVMKNYSLSLSDRKLLHEIELNNYAEGIYVIFISDSKRSAYCKFIRSK